MSRRPTELADPPPEPLLSTENRIDGGFSRQASLMDTKMLNRKRRLPVNHSSISAQCAGAAADSRRHSSRARHNHLRPHARATAPYTSRRFVPAQPEGPEWEAVQEMYLASRPRFVRMAHSILRNKEDAEDA